MPEVLSIEVDEEFDPRPPAQPFGIKGPDGSWNIGFIAGIAAAVVLVIALVVVVANPFASEEKKAAVKTWTPTDPLKDAQVIPNYTLADPIFQDLQTALEDWAKFYTTGDISDIENSFDLAGKQYALLLNGTPAAEGSPAIKSAAEIKAEVEALATPPEEAKIELGIVANAGKQDNLYTMRADITWTQPGGTSETYKWDIKMKKDLNSGTYLLSTIKTTDTSAINGLGFCDAVNILNKLENDEQVNKKLSELTLAEQQKSVAKLIDVRFKVWQTVKPAFVKSSAPDAVAIIIDQYKQSKKLLDESKSLKEFVASNEVLIEDESIVAAHSAVVDAAQSECPGVDISDR